MALNDPGNAHAVVYAWGTYGIGYNEKRTAAALPNVPLNSWRLVFDPKLAAKLADCGINFLDAPAGVDVADARAVIADETLLHRYLVDGKPSLASFSDRFRYSLMERAEVCWVDADIICLAKPRFEGEAFVWGRQPKVGRENALCGP